MSTSLSQHELAELYDKAVVTAAMFIEQMKDTPVSAECEDEALARHYAEHVQPLVKQYPQYEHWIMTTLLDLQQDIVPSAPQTNDLCSNPFASQRFLYNPRSQQPTALSQATQDQVLRIMLTSGNDAQVFAAAKEIGMIPQDVAETAENAVKIRTVVATLSWLNASYGRSGAPVDPLQPLRHAREYMKYGQAQGDSTALIGSSIDGEEVREMDVGKGITDLNWKLEIALRELLQEADMKLAVDPTRNGLVALYIRHLAEVHKAFPAFPRFILCTARSRLAVKLPQWAVLEMAQWNVAPQLDPGSPFVARVESVGAAEPSPYTTWAK